MSKHKVKLFNRRIAQPSIDIKDCGCDPKKTALALSGGGSRGAYQIGVWKALREMGICIDIVVGSSIGAINAAAIAQGTYESAEALWYRLETDMVFDYRNILKNKGVQFTTIKDILAENIIEEDVRNSCVDFGTVTVKYPSLEPLYLWKEDIPEGEMLDYVLASSACFPAVTPYEIHDEKFLDGSFYDYMPISLALEKGAGKIIAVNLEAAGKIRKEDLEIAKDRLTLIESRWDLGSFLIFDKENTKHIMRLGFLDTLKAFEILDGFRYAFGKGQMDLETLEIADYVAFAFGLDPEIVYTKQQFMQTLKDEILLYGGSKDQELAEARTQATGFSLVDASRVIENISKFNRRAIILFLVELIKKGTAPEETPETKPEEDASLLEKAFRRIFDKDFAAADWLIKSGLL